MWPHLRCWWVPCRLLPREKRVWCLFGYPNEHPFWHWKSRLNDVWCREIGASSTRFQGSDTQCCVPTCESHTCTQDGFVPNETAKTEVCTGQACSLNCLRGRSCCQPQRDREGGAEVLKVHHWWYIVGVELSKTFALCKMFLGGDGQCCVPTCESHTCTQDGFVPNETAKTEVCTKQDICSL